MTSERHRSLAEEEERYVVVNAEQDLQSVISDCLTQSNNQTVANL
jgi:thymidylate kinase